MPSPSLPLDQQYQNFTYRLPELEHHYGPKVHLLSDPFLLSLLAKLCAPETHQPWVNELTARIYGVLLSHVLNNELSQETASTPTRMHPKHPNEGVYRGPVFKNEKIITVNLARAGTLPSHTCYSQLNYLLDPASVRQDHISISRQTNSANKVTGSELSGHKIGGPVDGAYLLFPDPMAATGSTLEAVLKTYQNHGRAKKQIGMHCIITPEYIRTMTKADPNFVIYAVRLDRGLSSAKALQSPPGLYPQEERGLNQDSYIVPGGGGFGEVLNNAYV